MKYPVDVCVIGGSGLVGNELLLNLSQMSFVRRIKAVTRRPLKGLPPKTDNIIIDFDQMERHQDALQASVFICCLGSTIKKAGSQEAFYKVDHDYVIQFAKVAEKAKAEKFLVISSMGANPKAMAFYSRVKGEMEKDLRPLKIPQVEIFRPSLILGERKEERSFEELMQKAMPAMSSLMIGPLKKYRAIKATDIAKAMSIAVFNFHPGHFIYESDEIQRIADGAYHQHDQAEVPS